MIRPTTTPMTRSMIGSIILETVAILRASSRS